VSVSVEVLEGSIRRTLPSGWRWVKLGEIAEYFNGRAFKPEEWSTSGLPIIRIQNLNSSEATFHFFNGEVQPHNRVEMGDLLISWSASLDAYIWRGGSAVVNQHIFKVVENSRLVMRDFLYFVVRSVMAEIRTQVHGATMQHITRPQFLAIEVPLPPIVEQRRIVAVLTDQMAAVDRARTAAEPQLAAAEALPAAYLRDLFEGIGAQKWPQESLRSLGELLTSRSISTTGDTEVVAITTACLSESGFRSRGVKKARMWAQNADNCRVELGEVLIARSNTTELVGRAAIFNGTPYGAVASDLIIRYRPRDDIEPEFIGKFLSYVYLAGYWRDRAGGASGSMKKLTRTQVLDLTCPVPTIAEQRRVVARLMEQRAALATVTESLDEQLCSILALPSTLLNAAFNGKL